MMRPRPLRPTSLPLASSAGKCCPGACPGPTVLPGRWGDVGLYSGSGAVDELEAQLPGPACRAGPIGAKREKGKYRQSLFQTAYKSSGPACTTLQIARSVSGGGRPELPERSVLPGDGGSFSSECSQTGPDLSFPLQCEAVW